MDKLSLSAAKKLVNANVNDHEEKLIEEDDETYGYTSFAASLLSANEYWRSIKNEILGIKENFDSENEKAEELFGINEDDKNITKEVDNKKSEKKESLKDKIKRKKESIKEKVNKRFEKIKQKLLTDDDDTDDSSEDLTKEEPVKISPKIMEDSKKSGGGVENEFGSQSSNGGSGISGINSVSSSEQSDKTGSDMMLVNEEQEEEKEDDDDNNDKEDEEENKKEEDNENNKDEIKNDNLQNVNNQNEIGSPSGNTPSVNDKSSGGSNITDNSVGSNGSSGGSATTDSSSDSDISSISTDESKEDNDAIKSIDFEKTDDEKGIDAEEIEAPTKMSNILEVAKNIMKKSDGIYGVDGRNYIASILDILMKDQSSQPEKKSTEKSGKTKSKLNRKQTSSKLNPSIKKLKSGLQSLYEEYPPLDNEKQSSPMPEELKNNENIMRYAIKADFLNDAEKLIRDTLSQIYVVEKNNSQGNLSNFSIQGKRAIVILSTLLRQENNEGGNKENSYAHQYELMRKVISVRKKSSYSSHRRGKKTDSFETNLPHMRVLGIVLNSITKANNLEDTSKIPYYAKAFAEAELTDVKGKLEKGNLSINHAEDIFSKLPELLRGKALQNLNNFGIGDSLSIFLKAPSYENAKNLIDKFLIIGSGITAENCANLIYKSKEPFSKIINENNAFKKLFYNEEEKSQTATTAKKQTNDESTKK